MIVGAKELSDITVRRYFTTQLSVIGREGSTKSICHVPLLTKQARIMLESKVIVESSRMDNTAAKIRCSNMRRSCTNTASRIITYNSRIVISIINTLSITVEISSRVSSE